MRDVPTHSETEYECLTCGSTVAAETHPGDCPDCGTPLRNRGTALE